MCGLEYQNASLPCLQGPTLDDTGGALPEPRDKATIVARGGFKESGTAILGRYELQNIAYEASEQDGETMVIQAKAADLRRKLKGSGRKAYKDKTFGEIARDIAKRNELALRMDSSLEGIKLPDQLWLGQSGIDLLTRLGDEFGAIVKPAGQQLVVTRRGGAASFDGNALPTITIRKQDCSSWSVSPNGRPEYGTVKVPYIDQKTGRQRTRSFETGLEGPELVLSEMAQDEDRAERRAKSEGQRLSRETGQGHFECYGRIDAQAEATVIPVGFKPSISRPWRGGSVEHTFDEKGFITRINIKAMEDGSSRAKK